MTLSAEEFLALEQHKPTSYFAPSGIESKLPWLLEGCQRNIKTSCFGAFTETTDAALFFGATDAL